MHSLLQVPPGRIALRLREPRVQLERLAKLLDGLIVLARVEIVPPEMSADHQLQRLQFERALAFGQRLLCPSEHEETVREPMMCGRVVRIQRDGSAEFPLGSRHVPVIQKMNYGER